MEIFNHPSAVWLAIGVATIIIEFFVAPGLGIVFAGMGALTTGALLELELIESLPAQIISFAVATALWALLLWKPLKAALAKKAIGKGKSHIIGTEAIIAKGGVDKYQGSAKWSGTIMNAKLAADSKEISLKEGQIAEVVEIDGTTLILKPITK
jgi:hypothetical protein